MFWSLVFRKAFYKYLYRSDRKMLHVSVFLSLHTKQPSRTWRKSHSLIQNYSTVQSFIQYRARWRLARKSLGLVVYDCAHSLEDSFLVSAVATTMMQSSISVRILRSLYGALTRPWRFAQPCLFLAFFLLNRNIELPNE